MFVKSTSKIIPYTYLPMHSIKKKIEILITNPSDFHFHFIIKQSTTSMG